jgi:histidyl-tRNA synthetase
MSAEGMLKILAIAKEERANGKQVMLVNMKKNKKFQKEQLMNEGYTDIQEIFKDNIK